jgi:caa(3)-type oxidase subunit IV
VAEQTKHGSPGAGAHQGAHENHGIKRYIIVYLTLILFTIITVWTGRMDLGAANIFVAMAIAVTKATLVVLFFMHLYDEGGVNRLVFVVSLLFVAVLMAFVFGDLMTRISMSLPNEGPMPIKTHSGAMHGEVPAGEGTPAAPAGEH